MRDPYRRIAGLYDAVVEPFNRALRRYVLKIARPRDGMGEISRVTAADGRALFVDYHPGPIRFPKGWFYKAIIYSIEFGAGWEHFQNHRDFLSRNALTGLFEEHGMSVERDKLLAGGNIHVVLASTTTPEG